MFKMSYIRFQETSAWLVLYPMCIKAFWTGFFYHRNLWFHSRMTFLEFYKKHLTVNISVMMTVNCPVQLLFGFNWYSICFNRFLKYVYTCVIAWYRGLCKNLWYTRAWKWIQKYLKHKHVYPWIKYIQFLSKI